MCSVFALDHFCLIYRGSSTRKVGIIRTRTSSFVPCRIKPIPTTALMIPPQFNTLLAIYQHATVTYTSHTLNGHPRILPALIRQLTTTPVAQPQNLDRPRPTFDFVQGMPYFFV